jgi:filamentous hemagglutinin
MNKRIHRLVLDRRRGMLVPAAENTRSAGKAASGSSRSPSVAVSALLAAGLAAVAASGGDAQAAPGIRRSASVSVTTTLPQAATPGNPLAGGRTWVQTGTGLGTATMYVDGKLVSNPSGGATPEGALMMIRQTGLKAILNWDSFNIGVGKAVEFRQDSASASTLNYIWSADPSVIRGKISSTSGDDGKGAGGEVILQNTNGVIFANGARVDTGRFVATALSLSQDTFLKGLRNVTDGTSAVFGSNDENNKGFVLLEQGAEIRTAAGGDVLLIAPRVLNEGRIETPSGQTVMAAGQKVYMATSQDATQRGLVVAVSPFAADGTDDINSVEQAKAQTYQTTDSTGALVNHVNAIVAEKGRINLVGLSIKQNGLLSATNAVQGLNGAIYLQAMGGVNPSSPVVTSTGSTAYLPEVTGGGSVTFGAGSVTEVRPDSDESNKQVAAATFTKAKVSVSGGQILLQSGATISAKSGVVSIVASAKQQDSHSTELTSGGEKSSASSSADSSRVVVQRGATIDVSGVMDYLLPMSSNYLDAKLFSIELAKAPLQRGGVLYQKSITFDVRQSVAVADVSGALANVKHSALELSTTGGTVDIRSDGVLATEAGSTINFAGGSIKYADGFKTISLLRKGDTYVDVNHAKANVVYDELVQSRSLRKELGYTDGKNAGSATFVAPLTSLQGQLNGSVVTGVRQRNDGMEGASALPQAGTVTIGRTSRVGIATAVTASDYANTQIVFNAPSTGAAPTGSWLLDPLNGSTAGAVSQVNLTSGMFMSAGIGNLNLYADQIVFNAGPQLDLGTKGSLLAYGSSVNFNGDVRAAGGSITLAAQAGQLTLGEQARLTVAGAWSNDRVDGVGSKPLALDGGTVSLLAAGSVNTAAGSVVDASAGAWANAQGVVKKGAAGSITAATNADLSTTVTADTLLYKDASVLPTGELNLRGRLQAYGFASGGTLVLQGNHVGIGQNLAAGLNLDAATFFSSGGFGDITVRSFGSFKVAAGSTVQAQLASAVLNTNALSRAGSQTVAPVVAYAPLADTSQRKAVNITLAAQRPMTAVGNGADVEIGEGAVIQTEAGGKIKLSATGSVNVAGHLVAQGGSIALEIKGKRGVTTSDVNAIDDLIGQLDPTQGIWLTSTALLDVHGKSKTYQDALGRNVGSVLGGGTVSLTANRGYVVAQKGSVIDLGGASLGNVLLSGQSVVQTVSQAAGTLTLTTPEGFALEGSINARGPVGADMGGTLNAAVTLGSRVFTLSYATDDRQILLTTNTATPASASGIKPGANLKDVLGNGLGTLSSNVWKDAGFAEMNLAADDSIGFSGNMTGANAVQAARGITLDTRALTATAGSKVQLKAASVTLGNVNRDIQADTNKAYDTAAVAAKPGSITTLEVDAGLIDLAGTFGLQGWSDVALLATRANDGSISRTNGEIRLRGKTPYTGTALTGSLNFAGTLSLQAGQIYADTLTAYTINGNEGSLFMTFLPAGGSSSTSPLSALGSLTVNASTINHGGQIVQPFGAIALNADNLNLWANSLLSVSGEGLTVPSAEPNAE